PGAALLAGREDAPPRLVGLRGARRARPRAGRARVRPRRLVRGVAWRSDRPRHRHALLERHAPRPHAALLRWTLAVPRGNLSPRHLARILEPRPGERILEIGPGTGIYSVPVATALAPGGTLDVLDVQPAMLAEVTSRARAAGVTNVAPTH